MPTKQTDKPLNPKHELFVLEFLKDMNATRAYKEVYKSATKVAETNGCQLLRNTKVKEAIDKKLKERFAKIDIDGQWVIDRLVSVARKCLQEENIQRTIKTEEGIIAVDGVGDFDPNGANTALANLGKYFKLFVDRHQIEGQVELIIKKVE